MGQNGSAAAPTDHSAKKVVEGADDLKPSLASLNNSTPTSSKSSSSQSSPSHSETSILIRQSLTTPTKPTICQKCHRIKRRPDASESSHPETEVTSGTPEKKQVTFCQSPSRPLNNISNTGSSTNQSLHKRIYYSKINMTENLCSDKDSDTKNKLIGEDSSPLLSQPTKFFYDSFHRRPIRRRPARIQQVQIRPVARATPITDVSQPSQGRTLSERQLLCHTPVSQSGDLQVHVSHNSAFRVQAPPQTSTPKKLSHFHFDHKPATPPTSPVTIVEFHATPSTISATRKTSTRSVSSHSKENKISIPPNSHLPICPKYRSEQQTVHMSGSQTKSWHKTVQESVDLISEPIYEEIRSPILTPSKITSISMDNEKDWVKTSDYDKTYLYGRHESRSSMNPFLQGNPKKDAEGAKKESSHHLYENAAVVKAVKDHTELRSINGLLRASSVDEWLRELRFFTDVECLNTLQGKPITTDPVIMSALAIRDATEFIVKLQQNLEEVQKAISGAQKSALTEMWEDLIKKVTNVCTEARNLVKECVPYMDNSMTRTIKMISDLCCFIEQRAMKPPGQVPHKSREAFCSDLLGLKEACSRMADYITLQEVKAVIECLEEKTLNPFAVKWSIFALVQMSQQNIKVSHAITKVGGVQALINVCKESKWKQLWASALRALCQLCTSKHALIIFEKASGVDCLTNVLRDREFEEARREAAGLLAQITAPWMEIPPPKGIYHNMGALILSLTDTARATTSAETFLLSSAALANLSFLTSSPCEWMRRSETIEVLIEGCKRFSSENSLFIKDQVATVLANAAAVSSYRKELVDMGALVLLLCFLQLRPSLGHTGAESASLEGIQEKAAIAVSRLCSESATSKAVVQMQGVRRLVQLCKDAKERKFSDAVLVSCLAALRKIASVCGTEELEKYDACDLVQPKLWDSFLLCSYKQESYV